MQLVPAKCPQTDDRQSRLALIVLIRNDDNAALAFQKEWQPAGEFIPLAGPVRMEPDVRANLRNYSAMQTCRSETAEVLRVNACPMKQLALSDCEVMVIARIEDCRDAWCVRM